jgi:hypothetical protein
MSKIPVDGHVVHPGTGDREPFVFVRRVEGLLREAELKGVKFAQYETVSSISARIAELEKARAILKK